MIALREEHTEIKSSEAHLPVKNSEMTCYVQSLAADAFWCQWRQCLWSIFVFFFSKTILKYWTFGYILVLKVLWGSVWQKCEYNGMRLTEMCCCLCWMRCQSVFLLAFGTDQWFSCQKTLEVFLQRGILSWLKSDKWQTCDNKTVDTLIQITARMLQSLAGLGIENYF